MAMLSDLQKSVLFERVESCFLLAEHYFGRPFARPMVNFNLRGRAAGVAYLTRNELRFNAALYRANETAFLAEVVPHEIAHLLVHHLWGENAGRAPIRPHGPQWQQVMMQVFAVAPRRTHSFDISVLAQNHYPYHCACSSYSLSVRRHNKILRGQARYHCRRCQQELRHGPLPQSQASSCPL